MAVLNFVPETHDIKAYAGDTATIEVRAPAELVEGMVWHAEIRSTRDSTVVDASFLITEPTLPGDPAYITLSSVDSARLAAGAPVVNRRTPEGITRAIQQYNGVFDCQVRPLVGVDPVKTLVQGTVTVELDVTRPV